MEDLPAMDRPLRLEFVGPCYHVVNCGNFRFPVFREVRDCELQLGKLAEVAEWFRVRTVGGLLDSVPIDAIFQHVAANRFPTSHR
jgi:hypothetical protein